MSMIGALLLMIGSVAAVIDGIRVLVVAFKESALWGLSCLFALFELTVL